MLRKLEVYRMKKKQGMSTLLTYVALIIGAVIMIFPFIWMLLTAFKTNAEVMQIPPTILPSNWNMASFAKATDLLPFGKLYLNTILMIVIRVVCAVAFCSMAGYAFAKLNFKGKNVLFTLIIVQQMIPGQTFYKVMFPLTRSSVAALTVFTAVFAYTDLMWPLIVNTDINATTLSAGLSSLNGQFSTNYPVLMAGSLLAMLPMVALYLVFQKQFIEGVAMTGGK